MRNINRLTKFALFWLVAVPLASVAHHSLLNYDDSQLVDVEGEVMSVYWGNPHILIEMNVTTEAGEATVWTIEGGPVNQMERRGSARGAGSVVDTRVVSGIASDRGDEQ